MELFEHNQAAYDAAVKMMKEAGKAAIIHPTGTGKSFIGFRLCADHPARKLLWLSPSEYIFRTQLDNLKTATGGEAPDNIIFCTYAKLMRMDEPELRDICSDASAAPSYIILDEFHRCGAKQWGMGVQRLLAVFPEVPVLGLSATSIRYLDNQRDMADELFDGRIASEMTLGEAIVRGILNPPRYVLSVYSRKKETEASSCSHPVAGCTAHAENRTPLSGALSKYETRIRQSRNRLIRDEAERCLEELRRTLELADGLDVIFDKYMTDRTGKYIIFCSNKEHMDEMMEHLEWFAKVDRYPHVYSLYSNDSGAARSFDDFRKDDDDTHLRLLYCIDALNEGIHLEEISGVILLRPTVSPIIYKQQIGRALSASRKKDAVIFDIVMNLENLSSIGAVEEEMQLVTSYYRSLGESEAIVNEHFRILDEVRDCRVLFDRLNEILTASWDRMFEQAKAFYEENGNLEVPVRYVTADGYALGSWIFNQKAVRKGRMSGKLTEEQIQKLDSIGMVWEASADLSWSKNYEAAKRYRETYGDLNVPAQYIDEAEGTALGAWLARIRAWKKAGAHQNYLTPERIWQLNELGMVWDVLDYYWERNYAAAWQYYREHRSLDVPPGYVTEDGIRLANWIYRLRSLRAGTAKGTPPTPEQVRRLDAIGMIWSSQFDSKWEKGFRAAAEYAKKHGNLLVPVKYATEEGFLLGSWIQRQRIQYKKGTLTEKRRKQLEAIGMSWKAGKATDNQEVLLSVLPPEQKALQGRGKQGWLQAYERKEA